MAGFDFSLARAAASMAEGQQASVPIQSLLMQIDADAVCLVRTQFQHFRLATSPAKLAAVPLGSHHAHISPRAATTN
jgi:hypothetical protein